MVRRTASCPLIACRERVRKPDRERERESQGERESERESEKEKESQKERQTESARKRESERERVVEVTAKGVGLGGLPRNWQPAAGRQPRRGSCAQSPICYTDNVFLDIEGRDLDMERHRRTLFWI